MTTAECPHCRGTGWLEARSSGAIFTRYGDATEVECPDCWNGMIEIEDETEARPAHYTLGALV